MYVVKEERGVREDDVSNTHLTMHSVDRHSKLIIYSSTHLVAHLVVHFQYIWQRMKL